MSHLDKIERKIDRVDQRHPPLISARPTLLVFQLGRPFGGRFDSGSTPARRTMNISKVDYDLILKEEVRAHGSMKRSIADRPGRVIRLGSRSASGTTPVTSRQPNCGANGRGAFRNR